MCVVFSRWFDSYSSPEESSQLPWSDYFDDSFQIDTKSGRFQVYHSRPSITATKVRGDSNLFGAPATSLDSSGCPVPFLPAPRTDTIFFLIHGAGQTSLSWALVADRLRAHSRVIAIDLRAHGLTSSSNDSDLSLDTLARDCADLLIHFIGLPDPDTSSSATAASISAVGHSMGGAVAPRLA